MVTFKKTTIVFHTQAFGSGFPYIVDSDQAG